MRCEGLSRRLKPSNLGLRSKRRNACEPSHPVTRHPVTSVGDRVALRKPALNVSQGVPRNSAYAFAARSTAFASVRVGVIDHSRLMRGPPGFWVTAHRP